ncbi:MAG: 5'-deoxynucleotidase [Planctomycetes bacterium]|nr:5'-deoxynucleotidase [Planctomycetota bacterium]
MSSNFFAYISRMRLIRRWSLMQNNSPESIQEHSHRVALLAHALATIRKVVYGDAANAERAAFLALLHDAGEVVTGDLPTPVKYFGAAIREAYRTIEKEANQRLLEFLPPEFRAEYEPALSPAEADADSWRFVRAADKLCAWLKCVEERRGGNREFLLAEEAIKRQLDDLGMREVEYFLTHFAPGFSLTLDELGTPLPPPGPTPEKT